MKNPTRKSEAPNNLRSQTHERVDEFLLGRDSSLIMQALKNSSIQIQPIGINRFAIENGLPEINFSMQTCTSSMDSGDFRAVIANQVWVEVSRGSRLVMVVKKNATILRNLIKWLEIHGTRSDSSHDPRILMPALIIDDEADHASMNTSRDCAANPSTINRLIRQMLKLFERVGFVGYTATPFANIFADTGSQYSQHGEDIFPRSFIINLKTPSNYIGPSVVFGHPGDESAGIPEQLPLPMYINVNDSEDWLPDVHKNGHFPGPLPDSLKEAIKLFALNCAVRCCRGDGCKHNSMLMHSTRFINVQNRIAEQVEQELETLKNIFGYGSGVNYDALVEEFKRIWDVRLVREHRAFKERLGDGCHDLPAWSELFSALPECLYKIESMRINGSSTDALKYKCKPEGINVVAIGGDKLSRGLTLEGLSVSYFLRASRMFDTLMQMGRWFGYRPRYADLCRVYTTDHLYYSFREISLAMDDLRNDLDIMSGSGKTPHDFGLRVRTPTEGMLITAANKIWRGDNVEVRFADSLVQSLEVPRLGTQADLNRKALPGLAWVFSLTKTSYLIATACKVIS